MTQNPILDAPAVREARNDVVEWKLAEEDGTVEGDEIREFFNEDLDAYAAAILAEVKRRVEAMETEGPDESPEGRPVMVPMPFGNYLDRAAVLRVLDGGEA